MKRCIFVSFSPFHIAQRFCKTKQSLFVWAPAESTITILSLCQFAELTQQQYYKLRCPCFHLHDVMVVLFFFFKDSMFILICVSWIWLRRIFHFNLGEATQFVSSKGIFQFTVTFGFLVQCRWLSISFYLTCCQILLNTKINSHA